MVDDDFKEVEDEVAEYEGFEVRAEEVCSCLVYACHLGVCYAGVSLWYI